MPKETENKINLAVIKTPKPRSAPTGQAGGKNKIDFAVIKTGGKQYIVSPGQRLKIEKLAKEPGDDVVFDEVLLVQKNNKIEIGTPFVSSTKVKAKILAQGKGKKITVIKFKPKVRYHKKQGHRQLYTEIKIQNFED